MFERTSEHETDREEPDDLAGLIVIARDHQHDGRQRRTGTARASLSETMSKNSSLTEERSLRDPAKEIAVEAELDGHERDLEEREGEDELAEAGRPSRAP